MTLPRRISRRAGFGAAVVLLALAGCSSNSSSNSTTTTPEAESSASDTVIAPTITVSDAWVKAAPEGMTPAFATVTNPGEDTTLVAVQTEVAASTELHETVTAADGSTTMQEKDGGFDLPAGESVDLAAGGDHLMLIGLTQPLQAGDEVTFTFTFSGGQSVEATATVKDYAGANESYDPDAEE